MIDNCEVEYRDFRTNTSHKETFYDPYIFNVSGVCHAWNGERWVPTVSYAGKPILSALKQVFPKNEYDPANSGLKKL